MEVIFWKEDIIYSEDLMYKIPKNYRLTKKIRPQVSSEDLNLANTIVQIVKWTVSTVFGTSIILNIIL